MYQSSQYTINVNPQGSAGYSRLETIAESAPLYSVHAPVMPASYSSMMSFPSFKSFHYHGSFNEFNSQSYNPSSPNYLITSPQAEYHFIPDNFLKPGQEGIFVGKAEEIKEFIEEAFEQIFEEKFPNDIKISVIEEQQFRTLAPHPGTIGLSFNRRKLGLLSEIFVLNDSLARVMLIIGHELGHVLTETLENAQDEEAKAYAFSLHWMNVIKEHNIANLSDAIVTERPAANGLHNIAFFFVEKLKREGKKVWEIYKGLVSTLISVKETSFFTTSL